MKENQQSNNVQSKKSSLKTRSASASKKVTFNQGERVDPEKKSPAKRPTSAAQKGKTASKIPRPRQKKEGNKEEKKSEK